MPLPPAELVRAMASTGARAKRSSAASTRWSATASCMTNRKGELCVVAKLDLVTRHGAGPSRRLRLPRARRRRRRPLPRARARCTRCCTAIARRRGAPAPTGAAGPKARSSTCSSAPTARSSAASTRSAASRSSSPRTGASTRTCWCRRTSAASAKAGEVVVVEIVEQPSPQREAIARVVEVLGSYTDPGMEIEIALRKHDLPHEFSPAAQQAGRASCRRTCAPRDREGRVDLTRAAARHHRRRDGEGLRRRRVLRAQGQGLPADRRDRRRLALRPRRRRARPRRARARHVGLFPAPRDPDAAGGAVERALLAQARRSTACAWSARWTSAPTGAIKQLPVLSGGDALARAPHLHAGAGTGCRDPKQARRARRSALLPHLAEPLRALPRAQGGARGARRDRLRHRRDAARVRRPRQDRRASCRSCATTRTS